MTTAEATALGTKLGKLICAGKDDPRFEQTEGQGTICYRVYDDRVFPGLKRTAGKAIRGAFYRALEAELHACMYGKVSKGLYCQGA